MSCWSDNGYRAECIVDGVTKLVNVTVTRHSCGPHRKYNAINDICGVHGADKVWVEYGCYVTFNFCYIRKF